MIHSGGGKPQKIRADQIEGDNVEQQSNNRIALITTTAIIMMIEWVEACVDDVTGE